MVSARVNRNSRCHSSSSRCSGSVMTEACLRGPVRTHQRGRTLHVHRQCAQVTVPVGPQQLCDGRLAAAGSGVDRVEGTHRVGAHHPQSDPGTGDLLADGRILGRAVAPAARSTMVWSSRAKPICWPSVETPRSKVSRPIATFQPSPGVPDHEVGVGDGVVEEDLVELGRAGELLDGTHRHAGLVQRDQQEAQALVARRSPARCGRPRSTTARRAPVRSTPSGR